jgi:hypothetical protein
VMAPPHCGQCSAIVCGFAGGVGTGGWLELITNPQTGGDF